MINMNTAPAIRPKSTISPIITAKLSAIIFCSDNALRINNTTGDTIHIDTPSAIKGVTRLFISR